MVSATVWTVVLVVFSFCCFTSALPFSSTDSLRFETFSPVTSTDLTCPDFRASRVTVALSVSGLNSSSPGPADSATASTVVSGAVTNSSWLMLAIPASQILPDPSNETWAVNAWAVCICDASRLSWVTLARTCSGLCCCCSETASAVIWMVCVGLMSWGVWEILALLVFLFALSIPVLTVSLTGWIFVEAALSGSSWATVARSLISRSLS